jgi:hypothetical protein
MIKILSEFWEQKKNRRCVNACFEIFTHLLFQTPLKVGKPRGMEAHKGGALSSGLFFICIGRSRPGL